VYDAEGEHPSGKPAIHGPLKKSTGVGVSQLGNQWKKRFGGDAGK
jgi:hypothetical protein